VVKVRADGRCRMLHELLGQLAARKETFSDDCLSVEHMGELIDLVQSRVITGVFTILLHSERNKCSSD
jgi:hypothetical protein